MIFIAQEGAKPTKIEIRSKFDGELYIYFYDLSQFYEKMIFFISIINKTDSISLIFQINCYRSS